MKRTKKKAIFGSRIVNVAPVVRTIYQNDSGEEVIVMDGNLYKIADLKNDKTVFLVICSR